VDSEKEYIDMQKDHTDKGYDPVIILGMHRSGTSMIARVIESLGVFLGNKKDINHESVFFLDLDNWMMRVAYAYWDDPFNFQFINDTYKKEVIRVVEQHFSGFLNRSKYMGYSKALRYKNIKDIDFPWGWKDPRTTYTIDIWKEIFPSAKLVHIYRNPIDVAQSLRTREISDRQKSGENRQRTIKDRIKEFSLSGTVIYQLSYRVENIREGIKLWEEYTERAFSLEKSLNLKMIHIKFEDFLNDAERHIKDISGFLDLGLDEAHLDQIISTVNTKTTRSFLGNEDLEKIYREIKDREIMKRLGYDNII
jgi:hypothetical protein